MFWNGKWGNFSKNIMHTYIISTKTELIQINNDLSSKKELGLTDSLVGLWLALLFTYEPCKRLLDSWIFLFSLPDWWAGWLAFNMKCIGLQAYISVWYRLNIGIHLSSVVVPVQNRYWYRFKIDIGIGIGLI